MPDVSLCIPTGTSNETGESPLRVDRIRSLYRSTLPEQRIHLTIRYMTCSRTLGTFTTANSPPTLPQTTHTLLLFNEHTHLPTKAPRSYSPLQTDTFISTLITKGTDNVHHMKALTLAYLTHYQNHMHIYTDGSKTDQRVTGSGVYAPDNKMHIVTALHSTHSVYSAEMHTLLAALHYIQGQHHHTNKNFIILTDSLSSLHTFQHFSTRPHCNLYRNILDIHEAIKRQHKTSSSSGSRAMWA